MRSALVLFFLAAMSYAQTNPLAGDQAAIDVGKGNFRLYCAPCHGIHAEGGRGPDLTRGSFSSGGTDADLFRVVTKGVPGTEMASYAGQFDDMGTWRLIAFIRSATKVSNTSVPGNVHSHPSRACHSGLGLCTRRTIALLERRDNR